MAFWEDGTTRDVLLTIDRSFWAVCLLNVVVGFVVVSGFFHYRMIWQAVLIVYLTAALAVAAAIGRNPDQYYRHRGKVMLANRVVRIVVYPIMVLFINEEALVKLYITDKLAGGRSPGMVIFWILAQMSGCDLPWGLYFPLPFSQGIWLDIAQQFMRLMVTAMRCAHLLQHPSLKPSVTLLCNRLHAYLDNGMVYPMGSPLRGTLDQQCTKEGPLVLSLFMWWYLGCFCPSFSLWYVESTMKRRFRMRRRGNDDEQLGIWEMVWPYPWTLYVVASSTWPVLQVLLAHRASREALLMFLRGTPWSSSQR